MLRNLNKILKHERDVASDKRRKKNNCMSEIFPHSIENKQTGHNQIFKHLILAALSL